MIKNASIQKSNFIFFFSSRRRHTRLVSDWSSDVCSSDLPDLVLGDPSLSILEGVIRPWGEPSGYVRKVILPSLARAFKFDLNTPWRDLPATVKKVVLSGAPGKTLTFQYDSERWHGEYESGWDGVLKHVE